ncbi:MAG: hypothetical protein H6719_30290 [Sandaracinaceae bacterium]|nr:hypothetical protein [Sandaracinaceae bacterium]
MKTISRSTLSPAIKEAIRQLRYGFKQNQNRLTVYTNATGPYLPTAGGQNTYYEFDVGRGRVDRGRARIVALMAPNGEMLACYFTNTHYGSWMEIRNL